MIAVVACVTSAACGGHDTCRGGGACVCSDVDTCALRCSDRDCRPEVDHVVHGVTSCGDACTAACHDATDCSASCGDDCVATCDHASTCEADAGARGRVSCADAERCDVTLGPASVATCASVSTCAITCVADCRVRCDDVARCEVTCAQGVAATVCGDGTRVCGGCDTAPR